jgi:hypothetical protein
MIVDRIEESDNAINTFKLTPEVHNKLKVFQGEPKDMMSKRAEMAKDIVGNFAQPMLVWAVDLMYHSPLRFKFKGKEIKGYPEGVIIGESRTGKSDTALSLQKHYGIGNFTAVKKATTAGLLGGADKLPNGGFKVTWGTIPRNNKGLVILDEMSGMHTDVLASMTDMRSSGVATVQKMAKGKAPAQTRMLWISNPRVQHSGQSLSIQDYPTGVQVVLDLVGSDEDVARFDFCMLISAPKELSSPLDGVEVVAHEPDVYRNLIYWIWSRTSEQIEWGEGVEEYVWLKSQELNEKYNTDVKFFGAEAWKKLARIAVACAGATYSCTDGGSILVSKAHVDFGADFLVSCYCNPIFRLPDYVSDKKVYNETNESINALVTTICKTYPMVIKSLLQTTSPFPRFNLQSISGLENKDFNDLISKLSSNYLINANNNGFLPTRRLRLAVEEYRKNHAKTTMIPLTQQGGNPV